jgi:uncharacterized membrane protein HdeD (DUF308 family)
VSFQLRPGPGSERLLVDGLVTLVLAAMIWSTWPSSAAWVVGTLLGIGMVFLGHNSSKGGRGRGDTGCNRP